MSSAAQKPLPSPEISRPHLVLPAPALLVAWPSGWKTFLDNLADLFRVAPLPLHLTSAPGRFWPDALVHRPLDKKNFLISAIYHGGIVAFLYLISIGPAARETLQPPQHRTALTFFQVSEYLPEIHTAPPKARLPRKGEPALAKQQVISVPERADNREQTVIDPTALRILPKPVALPNLAGAMPVPPSPKVDALRATPKITFNIPQPKVIAPAAAAPERRISQLKLPNLPTPSVVEPAPTPDAIKPKLGDLNIAAPNLAVEAPKLPVPAQQASGNPEASSRTQKAQSALPPPPAVPASLGGDDANRLLALSLHPAIVEGPIEMPGGNRMGEFAASPTGKPDAPGTPELKASSAGETGGNSGTGTAGTPGAGISVAPPPIGAAVGSGGVVVQKSPQVAPAPKPKPATQELATLTRPQPIDTPANANPEEAVFAGKRSYSLSLNMPNLSSAGGSWIVRFAELGDKVTPGELSAPVAIEKVDPKYPASMMADGIEGSVTLYAVIRSDGTVGDVKVLRSLNDQLDENARVALAQWRFRPATKNGAPVALEAVVTIPFKARALRF